MTGQQVGLFLGPLFTLYKAASAVVNARALAEETGTPVVPVFWLQSEDHDLPEVARVSLPRRHGHALDLRLPASPEARTALAHLTLPPGVEALLECVEDELGELAHGQEHITLLRRHYRPGAGWVEAFAGLLAEIFADEGLVLVNPRTEALARIASPVHAHALAHASALSERLIERAAALRRAGFTPSVHVRPNAPLFFFHPLGAQGPRYRLEPAGEGLREVGGERTHARSELLAALHAEPMRFSTSALLRPILQDTLLPTAAYVGGPGEIAYFAQLQPLYEAFNLAMPLIVPRGRLRLIEPRARRLLDRLGLGPDDASRSEESLLSELQPGNTTTPAPDDVERRLRDALNEALRPLDAQLREALPGLARPLDKTRATIDFAITRLVENHAKLSLRRDGELNDSVRRLKSLLEPNDAPQERTHGFSAYAGRWGTRALVEHVVSALRPFDGTLRDVEP